MLFSGQILQVSAELEDLVRELRGSGYRLALDLNYQVLFYNFIDKPAIESATGSTAAAATGATNNIALAVDFVPATNYSQLPLSRDHDADGATAAW